MESIVYGDLQNQGIEVVKRNDHYFVRYDAGAHMTAWREDEITYIEFKSILLGGESEQKTMLQIQRRIELSGFNPYSQNWSPSEA